MKKIIIILFGVIVTSVFINEQQHLLIPDDAIRFRVIANSDSKIDQDLKMTIKNKVEDKVYELIKDVQNAKEAKSIINNNLAVIDEVIKPYNVSYEINYGNNYFPQKEYKGITYEAGNYESLVITLGNGQGHNWWCVLFPPLCLLDGENNLSNREYELFAKKIINKFN